MEMIESLTGLAVYLGNLGYTVTADALVSFFRLLSETGKHAEALPEMEPYLRPLVVKSPKESDSFHADLMAYVNQDHVPSKKRMAEEAKQQFDSDRDVLLSKRKRLQKQLEGKQNELTKLLSAENPITPAISAAKYAKLNKKRSSIKREYDKLLKSLKKPSIESLLSSLDENAAKTFDGGYSVSNLNKMEAALKELLPLSAFCKDYKTVMEYLKDELSLIKALRRNKSSESPASKKDSEIRSLKTQISKNEEEYELRLRKFQFEVERIGREIEKEQSKTHRSEFINPHNAVRSSGSGTVAALDKTFKTLTESERREISGYIRENSRKFKTKLSTNIRTGDRHRLDIPQICKKACSTNGVPMQLCYKKPKPDKANLLLILDISGSCKDASSMMLTLLYYLKDAFPAGCMTYAFTNKLYDISKYLDTPHVDTAVRAVLEAIPRSGAYSDYNRPLQTLYQTKLSHVNSDTIIIFIGDARNNKNPSGEDYMKALARKSRHAYWMNTEEYGKWNNGDSIMGTYAKYMRDVGEVLNTNQMIEFLMQIK